MNAPSPTLPDPAGATPVMAQFFEAKSRQPDALVFFRMGDFYELFFEDAEKAAAALSITLTARGNHGGAPIPMCGVPVHAAEAYLAKLVRAGFKVALCEQMEDPAEAKKRGYKSVVRRDVVRVVTPGTLTEDGLLDARGSNRLAAVAVRAGAAAVATVELSTGEVECMALSRDGLASALAALGPSETLVPDRLFADETLSETFKSVGGLIQPMASALAEPSASEARLKRLYGVETLDGFGELTGAEISALGLIAAHLETTQAGRLPALTAPRRAGEADVMSIDPATRSSLEIEKSTSGSRDGSLLGAIDRTITAWVGLNRFFLLQGQIWRAITFVFIPFSGGSILSVVLGIYFTWFVGTALEKEWGDFRYTLYFLLGMVGTVLACLLTGVTASTYCLSLSLLLAFAMLYPEVQLLLFFVIPIRVKYFGFFAAALWVFSFLSAPLAGKLSYLLSMLNVWAFFGPMAYRSVRAWIRREQWKRKNRR